MTKHVKKDEWDDLAWLHVYGQFCWHSEAMLRGTPAGLKALREAIDAALATGQMAKASVMASDGEGYHFEVHCVSLQDQLGQPEYIWERSNVLMAQEAERAREYGFRDPLGSYKRVDADERTKTAQKPELSTATK